MNIADIFRRQTSAERRLPDGADILSGMGTGASSTHPTVGVDVTEARLPDAERIRALAQHSQAESVVFQSVAVAALQMLDRVLNSERQLAATAISLGQQEKLRGMIASLESTVAALRDALNRRGSKIFNLASPAAPAPRDGEKSWWFALTETMHVLEEGIAWIAGAVAGQPKGSAARLLSSIVARLLHSHYNKLLAEADQWME